MAIDNPYSPLPTSLGTSDLTGEIVQDGNLVRTPVTATWPSRCVKCNASVPAPDFKARLQWYPRWIPLLFLIGWPIALIVMMVKRRWVNLQIGLCDTHRQSRRMWIAGFFGAFAFGVLVAFAGFSVGRPNEGIGAIVGFLGIIGAFVGLIGGLLAIPPLRVTRVEGDVAWVKVKPEFLASLPRG